MKSYQKLTLFLIFLFSLTVFTSFGHCRTEERTKIIYTDRDTYIDSYSVNSNYGGQDWLLIGELIIGYDHTFLHFDLSEIPEVFTKALLSLNFFWVPETIDISIYSTSNNWNEYSLTWTNAPVEGSLIGNYVDIAESRRYRFIISTFMQSWSSDEISLIVKEFDYSELGYIQLSSKEGASSDTNKPHLIFYYNVEIDDGYLFVIFIIVGGVVIIGIAVFLDKKNKARKIQEVVKPKTLPTDSISNAFCSNCGAKKIEVGSFCSNCGKKQI